MYILVLGWLDSFRLSHFKMIKLCCVACHINNFQRQSCSGIFSEDMIKHILNRFIFTHLQLHQSTDQLTQIHAIKPQCFKRLYLISPKRLHLYLHEQYAVGLNRGEFILSKAAISRWRAIFRKQQSPTVCNNCYSFNNFETMETWVLLYVQELNVGPPTRSCINDHVKPESSNPSTNIYI